MKKLITLIAVVAITGVAAADIIKDWNFTAGAFSRTSSAALNLQNSGVADDTGWAVYPEVWSYDAANNEADADVGGAGWAGFRSIGQVIKTADVRAYSATDALQLKYDAAWTGGDDATLRVEIFGSSDTSFGGGLRLNYGGGLNNAVSLGSVDQVLSAATGVGTGTLDASIADWSSYTYLVVRISVGGAPGPVGTLDINSVDIVPEPATVGMLGLGAFVALIVRRVRA